MAREFSFGETRGKLTWLQQTWIEDLAREHGARFVSLTPTSANDLTGWFMAPYRGFPHDGELARTVIARVCELRPPLATRLGYLPPD